MFDLFSRFILASVFICWGLSELLYFPLTKERFRITVAFAVMLVALLFLCLGFVDFYDSGSLVLVVTFAIRLGLTLLGLIFISRRAIQLLTLIRLQNEFINRVYINGFVSSVPGDLPVSYLERLRAAGWSPGIGGSQRGGAGVGDGVGSVATDANLYHGKESTI